MIRRDTPLLRWFSIALAFVLMVLPMPAWLQALRPFVLALVVVFWALETPKHMGLFRVMLIGLMLDLAGFTLLGESALRLLLIAGFVLQFRSQLRFYPVWQQSLFLMALLYLDMLLLWVLRAVQQVPLPPMESWLSPVLAFLLWPWLYMLLDNIRMQNRLT